MKQITFRDNSAINTRNSQTVQFSGNYVSKSGIGLTGATTLKSKASGVRVFRGSLDLKKVL